MGGKPTYEELEQRVKELKAMELERNQNEAVLDRLFSLSIDMLYVANMDAYFKLINESFEKTLGYSKEDLLKEPFINFIHPDDIASTMAEVEKLTYGEPTIYFENRYRCKDGSYKWLAWTAMPDPEKGLIYGVARDMTGQKQIEGVLRGSEARYGALFDNMIDGLAVLEAKDSGEDFVFVDFNEAAEKISRNKRAEVIGQSILKAFPAIKDSGLFEVFRRVWKTGNPEVHPVVLYKDDRITLWVENSVYKLPSGEIVTVFSDETNRMQAEKSLKKAHDELEQRVEDRTTELAGANKKLKKEISERKQSEEALRESEEKYRVLVENANDAIFIAQDEAVKFPNPKCEEMTGYSAEELVKMPFINLIHPGDRDMVLDRHRRRLSGEQLQPTYEFRIIKRAGGKLWVELNTVVINWEKRPATLNLLRDITQQKKLEAQFHQTRKMEAIGILAGGIAHEFNNALTGVVGNIQLLELSLPENKTVTEHTKAMKVSSQRMVNLTGQLLAYARGGKYQAKTMSLSDFVENTLPIIKSNIDPSIRLETDLPRDVFSVKADPTQMQMVLSAVVSNSSEAIEGEGRIRVITSNEEVDTTFAKNHPELNPGSYVCLTVEDDGKGMDEETLNKIFDPFYTTKFIGRGLGMAAVYGIIRNHDGWIKVDSELNKGTIIRIYLPAIEDEEVKKEAIVESATERPKGEGTILIIEDEEVVMKVIRSVLERLGYRMLEATTGKEAIEISKTFDGDIDLALLDIKLPDIMGDKVYPLIMKARPNLKVIVCSGYSIDTARGILDAGAQDFIQKPFTVETLSVKLRKVLENG